MTKEILNLIKSTVEQIKDEGKIVEYDMLEDYEKSMYKNAWDKLLKLYKENPNKYSYTIEISVSENVMYLLIRDGFKVNINSNYIQYGTLKYEITQEKILEYYDYINKKVNKNILSLKMN